MSQWPTTLVRTIHDNERARMATLRDCQAIDVALAGDGACVMARGMRCGACLGAPLVLWFPSRGWVCSQCEDNVAGEPPSADQRRVRTPNTGVLDRLSANLNRNLFDAPACS